MIVTRKAAIAAGMTHEGTLFGVPAWLKEESADLVWGCPKFLPLQVWCWLADKAFELFSYVVPEDMVLVAPIRLKRRIDGATQ